MPLVVPLSCTRLEGLRDSAAALNSVCSHPFITFLLVLHSSLQRSHVVCPPVGSLACSWVGPTVSSPCRVGLACSIMCLRAAVRRQSPSNLSALTQLACMLRAQGFHSEDYRANIHISLLTGCTVLPVDKDRILNGTRAGVMSVQN